MVASNVWIVDDDRSIRWVLEKALEQAGLETRSFESGEQVIRALQQDQPTALVSDIRMPGID
ncbi:MAG TPA: response regulator, partial [Motiliproteus sp.]